MYSRSVYDAFRKAMLSGTDSWKSMVAHNVTLIGPLGTFLGLDQFVEVNTPFFASIKNHHITKMVGKDDWVVTQITVEVKMPTGKVITLEVAEWYEIYEDKVQYLRTYFDPTEYLAEMVNAGV